MKKVVLLAVMAMFVTQLNCAFGLKKLGKTIKEEATKAVAETKEELKTRDIKVDVNDKGVTVTLDKKEEVKPAEVKKEEPKLETIKGTATEKETKQVVKKAVVKKQEIKKQKIKAEEKPTEPIKEHKGHRGRNAGIASSIIVLLGIIIKIIFDKSKRR